MASAGSIAAGNGKWGQSDLAGNVWECTLDWLAPFTTTAFERNVLLVALPFACAVTLACLCLFPLVERPFMYSNWPQLVWRAVRERRWGVLRALWG